MIVNIESKGLLPAAATLKRYFVSLSNHPRLLAPVIV